MTALLATGQPAPVAARRPSPRTGRRPSRSRAGVACSALASLALVMLVLMAPADADTRSPSSYPYGVLKPSRAASGQAGGTAPGGSTVAVPPTVPGSPASVVGVPRPAATTAPALEVGFSLGELVGADPSERAALVAQARRAGASTVRFDVAWSTVQPDGPSSWDWTPVDAVVRDLRSAGLRPLPVIGYTPSWARDAGCSDLTCPPADDTAFAAFARAAVQRYDGPDIAAWEIWNEPNHLFWSPSPDPQRYAALLVATADAVHATGTRAPVLSGGLSPGFTSSTTTAPADFLRAVYAAGAGAHIDGVAVHPYSSPALPGEDLSWSGWRQMLSVRQVMVDAGAGGQSVWATEFGTSTTGTGAQATLDARLFSEHPDHADDALQAATVTAAFAQQRTLPWLKALIWYSVEDLGSGPQQQRGYGLFSSDGTPKPALEAWRAAVQPRAGRTGG